MGSAAPAVSTQTAPQAPWQRSQSPQYLSPRPLWDHPRPEPFYHPPPIPSSTLIQQPSTEVRHPQHVESQRSQSAPPEPLNDAQEVLAQTAQTFVDDLDSSSLLKDNPKLAQSRFLELVTAVGRKEVVVQEPEGAASHSEEVGRGATFVERPSAADWAADFMTGTGVASSSTETTQATAGPSSAASLAHHRSSAPSFAPSLSQSAVPNDVQSAETSRWEEEFARASSSTTPAPQRRKSVHFAENDAQTSLENEHDFDQETFADFHSRLRQARTPRLGIGAFESWEKLQNDREALHGMDHWPAQMRGMGIGDQAERYLFQSSNPYTAGAEIDGYRQKSPTRHVSMATIDCVVF